MKRNFILLLSMVLFYWGCSQSVEDDIAQAEKSVSVKSLEENVKTLSSDDFMGRMPFTEGETKTINFLKEKFEELGLEPGNNGSYFQDVPMVEMESVSPKKLILKSKKKKVVLDNFSEFLTTTKHIQKNVKIENSEVVFVGYGIVAPEYNWNDYAGIDVKGKTVLVLVNDPGYATQDANLFKGNAMTYYGRWTYKYEEAARQGAAAVIVIHETGAAGYGWHVLQNGRAGKSLLLAKENKNADLCKIEAWVTTESAKKIFAKTKYDYDKIIKDAAKPGFKAFSLGFKTSIEMKNKLKFNNSKNVLALLPGSEKKDECIVYTAHWDHLGVGPEVNGDTIYNGFADNGIPCASMLETARAFSSLKQKPKRSILFLFVTAEESSLLGSKYYASNPVFPIKKTVANLNYELFLPMGRMKDVTITGFGQSDLEKYVEQAAKLQDRYIVAEPFPENGMYFRSDHFSFARAGVPSLFVKGWSDSRTHGKEWAQNQIKNYWKTMYHKPADQYRTGLDYSGNAEDAKLFFRIGMMISEADQMPQWSEKSEFKHLR